LKITKLRGLIREIKPAIKRLWREGFHLSNDLIDKLLIDLGEK